ncbi:hypothetical protein ACHAXR_011787 [Thalassiosira sp. AJA248-18]
MIRAASFLRPAGGISATMMKINNASRSGGGATIVRYLVTRSSPQSVAPSSLLWRCRLNNKNARLTALRSTSSSSTSSKKETSNNTSQSSSSSSSSEGGPSEGGGSSEIVLTPGEKVVAGTRLFFWAGALSFASVCAYYIGKELIPTKMSPNTIFDKASSLIKQNEEVKRRFGDSFKTYGRDHGGHREGRRNFIEHTDYTDPDDGTKRTRVRFNLEGQYGGAFVFAEVSKDMPSGEFVYILVQDKRNGAVIAVQDNRSALLAKRMAGGSQEGRDVFSNLLGGGKK